MKKKAILLSILFAMIVSCGVAYSQADFEMSTNDSTQLCNECDSLYNRICPDNSFGGPQNLPQFPGGDMALLEFIKKSIICTYINNPDCYAGYWHRME